MAIISSSDIAAGLVAGGRRAVNKATVASQIAGVECSLWRSLTLPAQGAIPGVWSITSNASAGAMILPARTGLQDPIIAGYDLTMATAGNALIVNDRLGHMGGLSGILATAQVVGASLAVSTNNLAERIGAADGSEVEWYLEWYTATGATVATPTFANVVFFDNTVGTATIENLGTGILPATVAAQRRYRIVAAKPIREIPTVQLSIGTGTAGSFGVTAVRKRLTAVCDVALKPTIGAWAESRAAKIPDQSCLELAVQCITTSSGAVTGGINFSVY